jgi:hypothetical protein
MLRAAVLVLSLSMLGACGTANVSKDYKLGASREAGTLVMSLTRSLDPAGYQGRLTSINHMNLQYVNLATGEEGRLAMGESMLGTLSDGAFDHGNGRLFVLDLPPGEYAIRSFRFSHNSRVYTARPGFSLRFTVSAGMATYAGEMNVEFFMLENMIGSGVVDDYTVKVKDSRDRDFGIVAKSYPNIPLQDVRVDVLRAQERIRGR